MARKLARTNTGLVDALQQNRENRGGEADGWRNIPVTVTAKNARIAHLDVEAIGANPDQPRRRFDDAEQEALRESIARYGLLEPIGVKPLPNGLFQLVYGERRLRAIRALGHSTIACVCLDADVPADEITVIENLQRVDLDPFEEADAYGRLAERRGYSYAELAAVTGRSKSEVGRAMSLLKLSAAIRAEYAEHRPPRNALHALAAIKDEDEQVRAWERFKAGIDGGPGSGADTGSGAGTGAGDAPDTAGPRSSAKRPAGEPPANALLSALPLRVARKLHTARDVLTALTDEPKPLAESDLDTLRAMRDAIHRILTASGDGV